MEMFESETRGPANETRGPTNDTGASKRHITGDRSAQAGAKRSIDPTSAFGLRSEIFPVKDDDGCMPGSNASADLTNMRPQ